MQWAVKDAGKFIQHTEYQQKFGVRGRAGQKANAVIRSREGSQQTVLEKQQNLGPAQRQSTDEKEIPADLFGTAAAFGWRVLISSSWGVVLV